ncbi:MAG: short chain dehydrogenase [Salinivirgaceae bacterium]|nr:short chain dehydrogenase [Salinivirgaceae bacterium]
MRIVVIGANGTIGRVVYNKLIDKGYDVTEVYHSSGDYRVDIRQPESIQELFKKTGKHDAIVSCVGKAYFGSFNEMTLEDYYTGFEHKVMGQVALVKIGIEYLNPGGSFTLTTGITCDDPIPYGTGLAMANGALNAFVKNTAINLENDIRINAVSPGLLELSAEKLGSFFPGHTPVPTSKVINAYLKSIEGKITGQIIRVQG